MIFCGNSQAVLVLLAVFLVSAHARDIGTDMESGWSRWSIMEQVSDKDNSPTSIRQLLQEAEEVDVTVVNTPEEYVAAAATAGVHIEIRSHLVLAFELAADYASLPTQPRKGNCTTPPSVSELGLLSSTVSLDSWKPGQCVIVTNFAMRSLREELWLHNIYFRRHGPPHATADSFTQLLAEGNRSIWLTNCIVQGDGSDDPVLGGLSVYGAQVYAKGVSIIDFHNASAALWVSRGATVTLQDSTITRNSIVNQSHNSTLIGVSAAEPKKVNTQHQDTILRLQNVTLSGNSGPPRIITDFSKVVLESEHNAEVYSDQGFLMFIAEPDGGALLGASLSMQHAPSSRPGINSSDPWFVRVQEEVGLLHPTEAPSTTADVDPPLNTSSSPAPPTNTKNNPQATAPTEADHATESSAFTPESPENPSDKGNGKSSIAYIVGGVVAVVLICMAAMYMVFIFEQHRQRSQSAKETKESDVHEAAVAHRSVSTPTPVAAALEPQDSAKPEESPEMRQDSLELYSLSVPEQPSNQSKQPPAQVAPASSAQQQTSVAAHAVSSHAVPFVSQGYTTSMYAASKSDGAQQKKSVFLITTVSPRNSTESDEFLPNRRSVLRSVKPVQQPEPPKLESQQQRAEKNTFDMTYTCNLLPPPGPNATTDEQLDFIQQQLDGFGTDTPMIDDLVSLGCGDNERRQGGQAIVQMAIKMRTRMEYAIKFFLSGVAFDEELRLYWQGSGVQGGDLAQFLPQVLNVYPNKDGKIRDMQGHPLPPCIVMEKGESLDLWADRRHPDRSQAFSMMHQVATRVKELHALGYVHRDLKPGNLMWLPRENRWTIIDFGCVARTGTAASLGFSVTYAAPEVIAAYRRNDYTILAEEAVDVWSLGVVAFELLTGKPAFSMAGGKDQVMDRIEGLNNLKLPWEGTLSPAVRRQLGIFRSTVLQLLARDAAKRPSMEEFCVYCDRVLSSSTSVSLK